MKIDFKTESDDEITLTLIKGRNAPYISVHLWDNYEGRGGGTILMANEVDSLISALTDLRKEMN